ncbi:MAG TPA: dienelactone hydrolase family protein [Burkholderiales bacterium]|nr:dienelactone hydrolase family protein [Burkholderiales bacterium]
MNRNDIRIRSSDGGEFDCYVVQPDGQGQVPAVVIAAAVHGVDEDVRQIADELASHGYIVAAPDLFWRTIPGPLGRDDNRTKERSQPRLPRIKAGETDMRDALGEVKKIARFNGNAIAMGFCYGGPYAILGPKRLGYAGGVSCHGTSMLDFIGELEGVTQPVLIVWGDQDHAAPPPVQEAYREIDKKMPNVDVHIFPGVLHGYMMPGSVKAYDQKTRDFTMQKTLAMLESLKAKEAVTAQ